MAKTAENPFKTCGRCGGTFQCWSQTGECWCKSLPHVSPIETGGDCLCPSCLAREIGASLERYVETTPHDEALGTALAQPAGQPPMEWIDYTIENGDAVFTSWYLLKQGGCCGNGCRNCPYPRAQ